jgi:hypothetical protein
LTFDALLAAVPFVLLLLIGFTLLAQAVTQGPEADTIHLFHGFLPPHSTLPDRDPFAVVERLLTGITELTVFASVFVPPSTRVCAPSTEFMIVPVRVSAPVPLMAVARHRANVAPATPALLVYSARTWDDIVYRDELVAMAARDPAFRLVLATTREPRRRAQDLDRRIDDAALRDVVSRWGHVPRHVYACGSNAFVGAVTASIVRDGVPAERVRAERYGGVAT